MKTNLTLMLFLLLAALTGCATKAPVVHNDLAVEFSDHETWLAAALVKSSELVVYEGGRVEVTGIVNNLWLVSLTGEPLSFPIWYSKHLHRPSKATNAAAEMFIFSPAPQYSGPSLRVRGGGQWIQTHDEKFPKSRGNLPLTPHFDSGGDGELWLIRDGATLESLAKANLSQSGHVVVFMDDQTSKAILGYDPRNFDTKYVDGGHWGDMMKRPTKQPDGSLLWYSERGDYYPFTYLAMPIPANVVRIPFRYINGQLLYDPADLPKGVELKLVKGQPLPEEEPPKKPEGLVY